MQVLNAIKKIAAVGTGVAMLGATLTGALALKLSDYPAPFVDANGVYDNSNVFVVGENAAAADTLGVAVVTANLQFLAREEVNVGGAVVVGAGQKLEDIPLGTSLNDTTNGFGSEVDSTDISALRDTVMSIDINQVNDDYDYKEEISLGSRSGGGNLSVETGLTYQPNIDEKWGARAFVVMEKNSWGYYFVFEDTLKAGNYLNDTSSANHIDLPFLGSTLRIDAGAATTITANIGDRFDLAAGDSVEVEGKAVVFLQASTGQVRVSVDGVEESISDNTEEIVNGLAVRVENIDNDEGIQFDRATFWIGKDARKTLSNAEEYTGEPQDNPRWTWHLASLNTGSPTVGIRWALTVDDPFESDNALVEHPLYLGEKMCLPENYACLEFNSLKITDYQLYKLDTDTADLYNSSSDAQNNRADKTSRKVLRFRAVGQDGNGFSVSGTNSDTLYFYMNNTGLQWYYEDQGTSKPILSGALSFQLGSNASISDLATIKFKDNNLPIDINNLTNTSTAAGGVGFFSFVLDGGAATASKDLGYGDIVVRVETDGDANEITYLGDSDSDTTTANDLRFVNPAGTMRDLTGWEEDTMTADGVIIYDPDAHKSSDIYEFGMPADIGADFKANIIVSVKGSAAAAASKAYLPTEINPVTKLSNEVSDPALNNLVVVGGPCANPLAASLFGLSCDRWALQEGEALLKLMDNGEKVALLVAGTTALDTRRATYAVAQHGTYLAGVSKAEAVVKGTSAAFDDLEVE